MTGHGKGGGHGAAQGKGTVGGHIGDVQHPEAEKQSQGNQSVDKAQLQRAEYNGGRNHGITPSWNMEDGEKRCCHTHI